MRNRNTYKRLCIIMMALGLVFFVGQITYAHTGELITAEQIADTNPTPENLKRLCELYKQDVEYHNSRREYDEANESQIMEMQTKNIIIANLHNSMAKTEQSKKRAMKYNHKRDWEDMEIYQNEAADWFTLIRYLMSLECERHHETPDSIRIEMKAVNRLKEQIRTCPTPKKYKKLAKHWNSIVNLATAIEDNKKVMHAKLSAAWAKVQKADMIANANGTPENYEKLAKCWDKASELYAEDHDIYYTVFAKEKAARARAHKADIIAKTYETPENYEKLAKCLDDLTELHTELCKISFEHLSPLDTKIFRAEAAFARAKQAAIKASYNETPENYESAAQCWDNVIKLASKVTKSENAQDKDIKKFTMCIAEAKVQAALARAKHAGIKALDDETLENYENAAQCWDEVVNLAEELNDVQTAAGAKVFAAQTRAQTADMITQAEPTPENYESAAQCWDNVIKLASKVAKSGNSQDKDIEKSITYIAEAKVQAAFARAKQAGIKALDDETLENYENAAQCWDKVVNLAEELNDIQTAAGAKVFAAQARAQTADMITQTEPTPENYENATQRWDEVVKSEEIDSSNETAEMARTNTVRARAQSKKKR